MGCRTSDGTSTAATRGLWVQDERTLQPSVEIYIGKDRVAIESQRTVRVDSMIQ
jgi:hypothetical protein